MAPNTRKQYRSENTIIAAILTAAQGGVTKTKIMYDAYLSYKQVMNYIHMLETKELIRQESSRYHTTEKGYRLLNLSEQIHELISPETTNNAMSLCLVRTA